MVISIRNCLYQIEVHGGRAARRGTRIGGGGGGGGGGAVHGMSTAPAGAAVRSLCGTQAVRRACFGPSMSVCVCRPYRILLGPQVLRFALRLERSSARCQTQGPTGVSWGQGTARPPIAARLAKISPGRVGHIKPMSHLKNTCRGEAQTKLNTPRGVTPPTMRQNVPRAHAAEA